MPKFIVPVFVKVETETYAAAQDAVNDVMNYGSQETASTVPHSAFRDWHFDYEKLIPKSKR